MDKQDTTKASKKAFVPDFRGVQNFSEIRERLIESAQLIMCSHDLVCGENRWQITALELYLFTDSDVWRDVYTHKKPEQRQSGTWYVHDNGTRPPTYSGVDITCGSPEVGIHAGLLVRELDKEQRWAFQRIVRGNRHPFSRKGNTWLPEEKSFINEKVHGSTIDSEVGVLRLVKTESRSESLWIGPRIGLSAKVDEKSPDDQSFRAAPLRIATWPTATNRTAMKRLG